MTQPERSPKDLLIEARKGATPSIFWDESKGSSIPAHGIPLDYINAFDALIVKAGLLRSFPQHPGLDPIRETMLPQLAQIETYEQYCLRHIQLHQEEAIRNHSVASIDPEKALQLLVVDPSILTPLDTDVAKLKELAAAELTEDELTERIIRIGSHAVGIVSGKIREQETLKLFGFSTD
jgi:hypothetical protein